MRRAFALFAALLLAFLVTAPAANAASPHFKKGGSPVCTVTVSGSTSSTSCSGALAGLGNGDVDLALTVAGFAVYQCQNQGGNIAPGQNKVLVGPTTEPTHIPGNEIKNGNLSFVTNPAVLTAPTTVTGAEAGCPNPNWQGVNPTLTTTSITLDISQGTLLFHCTASDPNGLTGTVPLSCS
jgi:hypothetical protein